MNFLSCDVLCRPQLILTVLDGLDIRVPQNISHFLAQQKHARFLECRYRDARNFLQVRMNTSFYCKKRGERGNEKYYKQIFF